MSTEEKPHILVVDDDDRLRALLGRFLRENGFIVTLSADANHARALLALFIFDLMVLDVMMPGESGLSLAASLNKAASPPVLMLSARGEAEDRVAGLEAGVDDYLTKPFEPKELLLRIRAILRRVPSSLSKPRILFGDYAFDPANAQLEQNGQIIHLTAAESTLLKILAENVSQPVSRELLAKRLGQEASERSIDVQITRLRKKIEPIAARPQFIQTVRGEGYVLNGAQA